MKAALLALLVGAWSLPCAASGLHPFKRGSWQALRESQAGKPLVVHFWGLTCGPCLTELPDWGKLARERPDADLVMIAADPYPERPAVIADTLARDGLSGTDNWYFDAFSQRLRYEVDRRWQGELPRTMLIGADGSIRTITGATDLAQVRAWIDAQRSTK